MNENSTIDSPPPSPIPPPPPPPHPSDYRPLRSLNPSSSISKLLSTRRESELNCLNKDQQQQTAPRIREISSDIGFVSLPDQVHRRAVKKGFEFNLMVVGQSGLGKSTFINTLFQTELYGQDFLSTVHWEKKTVTIDSSSIILKEKGVQLRLTIFDTPGFGD
ncbi:hypothetical protein I4U23_017425 [Adineta vaga]|nr:hypothetical protein I4U23_017425 [Adineta vaga]